MSFAVSLALLIGVLVVGPVIAHRRRQRRLLPRLFTAVRLIPLVAVQARRSAKIEDRALLSVRVLLVLLLALLAAGPLLKLSSLSVARTRGSSVGLVIVLDDSLSMSAETVRGGTRFVAATNAAKEMVGTLGEGDSVALVLAGAPVRVERAATSSLTDVEDALSRLAPSFRATDLEGALATADRLAESLGQPDRRIVLLSDLADGHPLRSPLGANLHTPLWMPLPTFVEVRADCAVTKAEREDEKVRAHIACSPEGRMDAHEVELVDRTGRVLAKAPFPLLRGGDVTFPPLPPATALPERVRLSGVDAIHEDDESEVLPAPATITIGFIGNHDDLPGAPSAFTLASGALAALGAEITVRPLASFPDTLDDLRPFRAVVADNPSGFTPEQRQVLDAYVSGGASAFLALGANALSPTLGTSFDPFFRDALLWGPSPVPGATAKTADPSFASVAAGLSLLNARGRATFSKLDAAPFDRLVDWADGEPLFCQRRWGRGSLWVATLPLSADASDLPFRPGFLALFAHWAEDVRRLAPVQVVDVGATWDLPGDSPLSVRGPEGALHSVGALALGAGTDERRLALDHAGPYSARIFGRDEVRVARLSEEELDLRPRRVVLSEDHTGAANSNAGRDVSRWVALLLLVLLCVELVLRAFALRKVEA